MCKLRIKNGFCVDLKICHDNSYPCFDHLITFLNIRDAIRNKIRPIIYGESLNPSETPLWIVFPGGILSIDFSTCVIYTIARSPRDYTLRMLRHDLIRKLNIPGHLNEIRQKWVFGCQKPCTSLASLKTIRWIMSDKSVLRRRMLESRRWVSRDHRHIKNVPFLMARLSTGVEKL